METVIRKNERSWAIDVITKINSIADANDLAIKRAGGESTISVKKGSSMFPDVILYGNVEQSVILQGWELKMPDIPIHDETFIKDAQRKARALGLNSYIIWNFTHAALYVRDEDDTFQKIKHWNETDIIKTRADVQTYRAKWENLLEKIIIEINEYFLTGTFRQSFIDNVISNIAISSLVVRNKEIVATELKNYCMTNSIALAYIETWWNSIKQEYEHDEKDMYKAYAKTIILNWSNRIVFSHIIKKWQKAARSIDTLDYNSTPEKGNDIFNEITAISDFYNVFVDVKYNNVLPALTWQDIVELSIFLKDSGIERLNHKILQNILERTVSITKREINGQYTTPYELARILVRLSVRDWTDTFMDCCCGTGTVAKAALDIKKEYLKNTKKAIESIWASDKYSYPLQIANISMVDHSSINCANRLFQADVLSLFIGQVVNITNPENGENISLSLPKIGTIASNLPFVHFENISEEIKNDLRNNFAGHSLDERSDLYCYISLKIADLLKENGQAGIITSNSWLGTSAGKKYIEALKKIYFIEQIHISGKGKWFSNADIVATILILRKKKPDTDEQIDTKFVLWKKSLREYENDMESEDLLVNSSLLYKEKENDSVQISSYSNAEISSLMKFNISYNALFHKVGWLNELEGKVIPLNSAFNVFRGSRRGWDDLFYPKAGKHKIEPMYIGKVLINARDVEYLTTDATDDAFCCSLTPEELRAKKHTGALEWIEKFSKEKNGVGKPLPKVLKKRDALWYELKRAEMAEFFTPMNPDKRLFFGKFTDGPAFINQRLIGFTPLEGYEDSELNHALLNSILTAFFIEASGFGRGLGVLDINKDNIAKTFMFDPKAISPSKRREIIDAFDKIKKRKIMNTAEELSSPDRLDFERKVFSAYGSSQQLLHSVIASLISMQKARNSVIGE